LRSKDPDLVVAQTKPDLQDQLYNYFTSQIEANLMTTESAAQERPPGTMREEIAVENIT